MSLSPFDSFQSRFVTYLLNFPRTYIKLTVSKCLLLSPSKKKATKNTTLSLNYLCEIDITEIKVRTGTLKMRCLHRNFTLLPGGGGERERECKKNNVQLNEGVVITLKTAG